MHEDVCESVAEHALARFLVFQPPILGEGGFTASRDVRALGGVGSEPGLCEAILFSWRSHARVETFAKASPTFAPRAHA